METFLSFMKRAEWLKKQNLNLRTIYHTNSSLSREEINALLSIDAAVETDNASLLLDCHSNGMLPENLFLNKVGANASMLSHLYGKCRYIAQNKEEVALLDDMAQAHIQPGYLETIAIRLLPEEKDDTLFTRDNIPQFSRWIRFSQALAVRGIFVSFDQTNAPFADTAKEYFSLIK